MDIKVKIKEEPCFVEFCSQNEREPCSKKSLKKVKSETFASSSDRDIDIKTEIIEEAVVSNFCSQDQKEFVSEHPVMACIMVNKDNEFVPKIEIKEEQFWVEVTPMEVTPMETLCTYDDYKDGTDEDFYSIKSPRLHKASVSSYTSDLFSTKDVENDTCFHIRKDTLECGSIRKCQSQKVDATDISSSVCTETPDAGKIGSLANCFKQNNLLQQNSTNEPDINKVNSKSTFSCEYRNKHKCDICKKSFKYSCRLKRHSLVHKSQEASKCDVCEKVFNNLSSLKKHKLIHECSKPHKCNICNDSFTDLSNLKIHKLTHAHIKPYKCNICDKAFTRLQHLKRHNNLIHVGIKPHKCNFCEKGFIDLQHLKIHKFLHEGTKPHKCNICDKTFTRLQHLNRHKLIHEGIKPHKYNICNICNRAFAYLQHLKRHKLIHEGIKPFKCNICEKKFSRSQYLKTHKLIHEDTKPH